MPRNYREKIFVIIVLITILLFLYAVFGDMITANKNEDKSFFNYVLSGQLDDNLINIIINQSMKNMSVIDVTQVASKQSNIKYILQWTSPRNVPFVYMGEGRKGFTDRNCSYTNCVVTSDRLLLGDYTKFDVIAFSGPEIVYLPNSVLPHQRSSHQKFVFASIESSQYYPVCSERFDGYFNWTWTFRLDSDSRWGYIVVRDPSNKIIGPNKIMHWMKLEDMDPVKSELKEQLKSKTKAAAWFVSNCMSPSRRENFVDELNIELAQYNLSVDIYGRCGSFSCPRNIENTCAQLIKDKYYFYLSFENSFSEDYVTEKLLHGLKNNAIPIVYGGANYTRFMPHGIYLNARELGPVKLAKKMYELMNKPDEYAEYFKWKNHYSYYRRAESIETDDYCGFCKLLNDEENVNKTLVIQKFHEWWDSPDQC